MDIQNDAETMNETLAEDPAIESAKDESQVDLGEEPGAVREDEGFFEWVHNIATIYDRRTLLLIAL